MKCRFKIGDILIPKPATSKGWLTKIKITNLPDDHFGVYAYLVLQENHAYFLKEDRFPAHSIDARYDKISVDVAKIWREVLHEV